MSTYLFTNAYLSLLTYVYLLTNICLPFYLTYVLTNICLPMSTYLCLPPYLQMPTYVYQPTNLPTYLPSLSS